MLVELLSMKHCNIVTGRRALCRQQQRHCIIIIIIIIIVIVAASTQGRLHGNLFLVYRVVHSASTMMD